MTNESHADQLRQRIEEKSAVVGIVGLGYVGLPLARAVHEAGYPIIGFDVDQSKIEKLKRGENYLQHLGQELTQTLARSGGVEPTSDPARLADAEIIILCVPTPLGEHREPDLSFVLNSTEMVARTLQPGRLVILESTTYPGTTRDEMLPILESSKLICGSDFFLAYSPEREDPGRAGTTTKSIPKLVGGVDEISGDLAMAFYSRVVSHAHRVATAEIAEAAKLLENIYRAVNIALVNEMKVLLDEMEIDIWDVIAAASTKPFGFQTFYPGPGLGGHCIPIDPFYLTWKAKAMGRPTKFIELAGEINALMPEYVVSRVSRALNDDEKSLRGAKILIIGIAYKPNIDDIRESPAAAIIELLMDAGADVSYHDPHISTFPRMRKHAIDLASQPLDEKMVRGQDCVIIVTNHDRIDYDLIGRSAKLIIDTRNAMAGRECAGRIVKA